LKQILNTNIYNLDDINKKICPKNVIEHILNMGGGAGGLRTYIEYQLFTIVLKQIENIFAFSKYFLYIYI